MRDARAGNIEFFTSLAAAVGTSSDGQSIVNEDELKTVRDAFKNDTVVDYVENALRSAPVTPPAEAVPPRPPIEQREPHPGSPGVGFLA